MSVAEQLTAKVRARKDRRRPTERVIESRSTIGPHNDAPRTKALVEQKGPELAAGAIAAWDKRVKGASYIDIGHELGLSCETVKALIREAHQAVYDDAREAIGLNRELDLQRIDGLIKSWYPNAVAGDVDSANVVMKCLSQRSRLTGAVVEDTARREQPQNVLVWIQQALPQISKIVESLPIE